MPCSREEPGGNCETLIAVCIDDVHEATHEVVVVWSRYHEQERTYADNKRFEGAKEPQQHDQQPHRARWHGSVQQ